MALLNRMIKTLLGAVLILGLACCSLSAATFSMKRGLNLDIWETWPGEDQWGDREVLLPYPEWRKHIDAQGLADLKAAGFDFLRIPIEPSPFFSSQTEAYRQDLYDSVLESVRMVNAAGLKAVVDMHLIPAGPDKFGMEKVIADPPTFDAYVDHIRTMAALLAKEDPTMVAFELMNEPTLECEGADAATWSELQKRLFAAARATATRLTLVLTGACMSGAEGLAAVDPRDYPDDNLIWTFHSYRPFLMTHQGATWAGDFIRYVTGIPYPPHGVPRAELDAALDKVRARISEEAPWSRRSGMLSYLDEQISLIDTQEKLSEAIEAPFKQVADWAQQYGIAPDAIMLGEFGMIRQEYGNPSVVPGASRAAYVRDMIDHAEARGFSWAIWDWGGAFGIVQEFNGRPAEPEVMDVVRGLR